MIYLNYNISNQFVLWTNSTAKYSGYTFQCTNKSNNNVSTAYIEDISPVKEQYSLFSVIALETPTTDTNKIYLESIGEYFYQLIYQNEIVDEGLLICRYSSNTYINYDQDENDIIYEES